MVSQYPFCFVDLAYRMAFAAPLYQTISKLISKAFLFEQTLDLFSEEQLGFGFRQDDHQLPVFQIVRALGKVAKQTLAEIVNSLPVKLIQVGSGVGLRVFYARNVRGIVVPRNDPGYSSQFLRHSRPA